MYLFLKLSAPNGGYSQVAHVSIKNNVVLWHYNNRTKALVLPIWWLTISLEPVTEGAQLGP
jgi:hypothetical protein